MDFLADQWLPILLSAVFVFIASSILHMVIPLHKGDYRKLPGEEHLMEAMRKEGVARGTYMFPMSASMKDCGSPEMIEKFKLGPVGHVTILPSGPPAMGKTLFIWFLYTILISFFVAYVGTLALAPGAEYSRVFRVTATVAFLGYGTGCMVDSIWKGVMWKTTVKFIFDGVVYALLTAGTFGWLWPDLI